MTRPDSDDVFEHAPDPMACLSADGALVRANAAFRAAFRHPIGPNRPPWGRASAPELVNGRRRFDATAPDGRRFEWCETALPDGRRIVAARDVSDRVRAAEEAGRAKTVLFATLTHELRTPLNGILGMTTLLERGRLDAAERSYLSAVRQSGEHLLDLITEILDYSRLEAGRVALEDVPFDPEQTAQSVAELLGPKAASKGLDIVVAPHVRLPHRVRGDDGRVRQILFNLAGNAVKFTEAGGVSLEIQPGRPRDDGRVWLKFSVRDTGPGIAPDKQAVIFEEFAQAEASTVRRYGGAGLGLAIVRRLARAMGGEVGLSSRPGQGALFWAELPFGAVGESIGQTPPPSLEGLRVGIVSRNALLRKALKAMLERVDGVPVAYDGLPPDGGAIDVLLLDHGAASAGEALSLGVPVIALTDQGERETVEAYRQAGVAHHLVKPVRRRSLAERILFAVKGILPAVERRERDDEREAPAPMLGLNVLLAEDNPVNALLARTLLTRSGCSVQVVANGEEAVAAAAQGRYDVILLDLRMPLLDGYGAARRIRLLPGPAGRTPLIALTADAGETERTQALAAGMDDFVTKPIDPLRLEFALARLSGEGKASTLASAEPTRMKAPA